MSKEHSQQKISRFFEQFKKLENSFTKEKVHQIINDPTAKARYKVKNLQSLNLIIMTSLICISVALALLYSTHETTQISRTEPNYLKFKNEVNISDNRTKSNESAIEIEESAEMELKEEYSTPAVKSFAINKLPLVNTNQLKSTLSDTLIDGSKFILELSNEELGKLGFQINHYTVFYRNSYNNSNLLYLATHSNGRMGIKGDKLYYNLNDYYGLQTDMLPDLVPISQKRTIYRGRDPRNDKSIHVEYLKSHHSFFPLFNTNQKGLLETIDDQLKFDELADTLMPIVIKCSQLDLEIKTDQFFWFNTNDDFYSNLPARYAWVKQEFENLKAAKRTRGDRLDVDFNIDEWNKKMLIPDGLVLNGKDKIIQLSKDELEKIGIFKNEKYRWSYSHMTPYRGSAGGLETKLVNGRLQTIVDTTFYVDYFIKYSTDCFGNFLRSGMSMKLINDFFNDDDILLPVQLENETGNIYWFTLSENLWGLLPERYTHLKEYYNKMLYNKSLHPERDFVKYFNDPFEKVGANVTFLELSKEELEKIGFKFDDIGWRVVTLTSLNGEVEKNKYKYIGTEINCGFGKNWIQYKSVDLWMFLPQEKIDHKAPRKNLPFQESVNYISPNRRFIKSEWTEKFDSLYKSSNQGYQFVYVTDSLGRHMQKISILQKDIQINPDDFKNLIPVMVRQSKLANEFAEDRVFWFTPTEAFFNRLPERIKEDIKAEYNIVSSSEKSSKLSTCTYFESCKSTLPVENLKVYPNPALQKITVEFYLTKTQEGLISLTNIAGIQIKVLKDKTAFNQGFNSFPCDLNGIKPGIYLISIVTKEGFKTERIIVSE